MTWETIAAQKRQALRATIPAEWVIPSDLLPPDSQLDVTNFLKESGWFTKKELEITSTPAPQLLVNIATGSWTSEAVTRAFCKAAAAAHQLVLFTLGSKRKKKYICSSSLTHLIRPTACLRFCLTKLSFAHANWTSISEQPAGPKVLSMVSQSQSRTTSISSVMILPSVLLHSSMTPLRITAPSSTCYLTPEQCST